MSVKASFIQRAKIRLFTRVASSADQSQSIDSNTGGGECTSCQLCVISCPEKLDPSKLIALVSLASRSTLTSTTQAEKVDDLIANNLAACTACGISEWNGNSIVLECDHIDGNSKNNIVSNLRLMCPNCHSQTDTFKGRNKNKPQ